MLIQRDNIEVNMRDLAIESVFQPNATLQDRQAQSSIASDNDLDAIQTWLAVKCSNSTHTQSAYAKEARRFLVFMAYELGLTGLSDVKVEHLEAYWQHLAPTASALVDRLTTIVIRTVRYPFVARGHSVRGRLRIAAQSSIACTII
jgi:hypothetical protein